MQPTASRCHELRAGKRPRRDPEAGGIGWRHPSISVWGPRPLLRSRPRADLDHKQSDLVRIEWPHRPRSATPSGGLIASRLSRRSAVVLLLYSVVALWRHQVAASWRCYGITSWRCNAATQRRARMITLLSDCIWHCHVTALSCNGVTAWRRSDENRRLVEPQGRGREDHHRHTSGGVGAASWQADPDHRPGSPKVCGRMVACQRR